MKDLPSKNLKKNAFKLLFKRLAFLFFIFSTAFFYGQEAILTEQVQQFPTYNFGDPNPLPSFLYNPKIYPYHKFQGYAFEKSNVDLKKITLENQWIEVQVFPEVGGKVWGAVDKSNGNEFIYKNEVAKFRNIAMRGPWTSGGIEFNFGIIGHHPGTGTPVDYKTAKLPNGDLVCTVGGIDLPSRTQWRVKIILPKDQSAFTTKAIWYNPTDIEQAYYNWMTAAAAAREDLVFYTPGDQYLTHGGEAKAWPIDQLNRDLSHYKENNFGPSKSYHVIGEYNDFFGGYYNQSNTGFGHWGRYDEIPGQKLWLWNLSRAGGIWEDLLTDADGQYIEYQAGRLYVQYFPGEENPISQATFDPHLTDQWTEVWFPVKKIGGIKEASKWGAMNIIETENTIEVKVNAFKAVSSTVLLTTSEKTEEQIIETEPNGVYSFSFVKPLESYAIKISGLDLHFDSNPQLIKRSFNSPQVQTNATVEKEFLAAKDAQRYRDYPLAEKLLFKVLQKDSYHLEARKELSFLYYRMGKFESALEVANMGLQMDAYHNGLNYITGLSYLTLNDLVNAKEHLGWAARSSAYRSQSNSLLAQIQIIEQNYNEAMHYNEIALKFNTQNINSLSQKAILFRILGEQENALNTLEQIEAIDPLNHLVYFEKYLMNKISMDEVLASHRSEFPEQTILELALFYHNRNRNKEAIELLESGPKKLLNKLWSAFIKKDTSDLSVLNDSSIAFVFPFRNESLELLHWVEQNSASWKAKYLLALNYLGKSQWNKGIAIFESLGSTPNDPLFYFTRGMLFKNRGIQGYEKDLQYAYKSDPKNWRYAMALSEDFFDSDKTNEALAIIKKTFKQNPKNYFAGMLLARIFNQQKDFEKTIALLNNLEILPYEHATEGRNIYTKAYVGSALKKIGNGDFDTALQRLNASLMWPENVGVGKPYDPEERWERFLIAFLKQKKGEMQEAALELQQISNYSLKQLSKSTKNHLLGIYAIQQIHGKDKAQEFIAQLLDSKHGASTLTKSVTQFYFKNPSLEWNEPFIRKLAAFLE